MEQSNKLMPWFNPIFSLLEDKNTLWEIPADYYTETKTDNTWSDTVNLTRNFLNEALISLSVYHSVYFYCFSISFEEFVSQKRFFCVHDSMITLILRKN